MALVPCRECGEQISSQAAACPKCGVKISTVRVKSSIKTGVIVGFLTLFLLIMFITAEPEKSYHAQLDYSRPVYTNDHAVICSQDLFFSLRADHDARAIYNLFMSAWNKDEKAKALGCQVWQEGIRVFAYRMDAPLDSFIAVKMVPNDVSTLFTMEGELKN